MRGLLGTLPPSPWCGYGLAGLPGLPWPGLALEERAQGPHASFAKTRGFHTQLDEGPETP